MLNFQSRHVWRAGFLVALAVSGSAAVGCGSGDNSEIGQTVGGTGGFAFGTGGGFVVPDGSVGNGGFGAGGLGNGGFGNGGLSASGGLSGTGGTGPDASASDGGGCVTPSAPVLDTSKFPTCSNITGCTDGRCVPNALVPAAAASLLATCDSTTTCAPDIFVAYANQYTPPTCKSVSGFEGRCLSTCIPQVAEQVTLLPQDICKASERCAPCYDPRTGADTKACRQGCDTGPKNPPQTFTKCCGDRGSCVPKSIVPASDVAQLGTDTCTGTDILCAPNTLSDLTYKPPTCVSLAGLEGRCLPDCLPAIQAEKDRLPKATCDTGDLCAPCYDPVTGKDTGACTINGDKPVNPPKTFDPCCGTLGHCVPSSILTTDQQSLLGKDTCKNTGDLCAPDVFAGQGLKPDSCRALGSFDAEGRCVPACLPSIQAQASRLDQATCQTGFLCAPCYDPSTGASTGACTQNGDAPKEPAKTFPTCCGGQGECVPTALVPTSEQSQLGKDTCTDTGVLCAPTKLIDPTYKPKTCSSIGGFEGRCLASCVPAVAADAGNLPKDVCDTGELCAPCYDPFTGKATGACSLNGDKPVEPVSTFPGCCNGLGHCVPTANLTTAQQQELEVDVCSGPTLCAPDVFAAPGDKAQTCTAVFGSLNTEGRCVPNCVPAIQAQASRLSQGSCPDANELCAPCYDPITGADTTACTQNGDKPTQAPKTFPTCCGNLGVCVPSSLVPPNQTSELGPDTCTGTGVLCAPKNLTDPTVKPPTCTAPGNVEGRCLPACLPPVQAEAANLRQETCATGELCAPCYNPLDGTDTGACRINGDAPTKPKVVFAGCCAYNGTDRGTCVPPELLSASQASSLPQDTCASGFLCAPNLKVQNQSAKFPSCMLPAASLACTPPILNLGCQGGCVPDCIVPSSEKPFLSQGTSCQAGDLCAPCTDPTTGKSTGACD